MREDEASSDGGPADEPGERGREALLARWRREGDVDALEELLRSEVEALASALRRRGGHLLRPSASASDLAQEAVFRMLRLPEPPSFERPAELRAYLWNAAWHLLVNRMRARRQEVVPLRPDETQELHLLVRGGGGQSSVERAEQADALNVVVHLLRPEDREVLELTYFRQLPVDEVARTLAISRGACEMRLTRARRRLAERLLRWAEVVD